MHKNMPKINGGRTTEEWRRHKAEKEKMKKRRSWNVEDCYIKLPKSKDATLYLRGRP